MAVGGADGEKGIERRLLARMKSAPSPLRHSDHLPLVSPMSS